MKFRELIENTLSFSLPNNEYSSKFVGLLKFISNEKEQPWIGSSRSILRQFHDLYFDEFSVMAYKNNICFSKKSERIGE